MKVAGTADFPAAGGSRVRVHWLVVLTDRGGKLEPEYAIVGGEHPVR